MTTDQIREMIAGDKYNFLRENIHLVDCKIKLDT